MKTKIISFSDLIGSGTQIFIVSVLMTFGVAAQVNVEQTASVTGNQLNISAKRIKLKAWGNEPISIAGISANGQDVTLGKDFQAGSDWLKDLSINVKNTSKKTITFIRLTIDFPETQATGNLLIYPMMYGTSIAGTYQKPLNMEQGDSVSISLLPSFEGLKKVVETRIPMYSVTSINIKVDFILFNDGLAWTAGAMNAPDPDNPHRYKPIRTAGNR